ncbi:MAG: hypothetical protein U0R72_12860 [Nakamurella multipartita]
MRNGEPVHLNPNIRLQSGDEQLLVIALERVRAATERRLRAVAAAARRWPTGSAGGANGPTERPSLGQWWA